MEKKIEADPQPSSMSSHRLSFLLLLFFCFQTLLKSEPDPTIRLNAFITAKKPNFTSSSAWFSPSHLFAFGFYLVGDEFAVGVWFVPNFTIIWTADRDGDLLPENSTLTLAEDGLQILSTKGDRSIANISTSSKLVSASMRDSGNFVVLDVNNNIIWQTFDNPTDTLMSCQLLLAGKKLVSSDSANNHSSGRFQMVMQEDGNIVTCPVNMPDTSAHFSWSSNSSGDGFNSVFIDDIGKLSLNRDLNATENCSLVSSSFYLGRMEPDGFLRTYYVNSSYMQLAIELPSSGVDKCSIKGACGPNSYCSFTEGEATCLCFPGFDYIDQRKLFVGCQRNFSLGECVAGNNDVSYSISRLSNVAWSDDPYIYNDHITEKDCHESCLQDCNCYAALFFSYQRCSKQRHPLLYGRSMESAVALLKVGSGEIDLPPPQPAMEIVNRVPGNKTLLLIMSIASILAVSLSFSIFLFYRNPSYQKLCKNMEIGLAGGLAPRSFTYQQLVDATDNFTKPLGKGGFSTVFRGEIPLNNGEMMHIAVKRLDKKLSTVNEKVFRTEMRAVGRAHHRNVVRLLGFCHEGPKWLLIYEYMSRGSLAQLIFPTHGSEARPTWKERSDIAMDVARGILYLHEGCETTIIHSDIKPENVLVDEHRTAKIGDLGLAKLLQPRQSKTYTNPRGTLMYKAPEWGKDASEPVSQKVDVYSFGVLLLELISCRKNLLVEAVNGCVVLSDLAYKCLMESRFEWMVPDGEDVNKDEVKKMIMVALWCLQKVPGQRKTMKEVVRMLGGKMSIPMPPDSIF